MHDWYAFIYSAQIGIAFRATSLSFWATVSNVPEAHYDIQPSLALLPHLVLIPVYKYEEKVREW